MRTAERARAWLSRRVAAALLLSGTACAGAAPPGAPSAGGVPGFDTRTYPGDAVMQQWRDTSPYQWVGYYLPGPCHPVSTWTGRRQALAAIGWGFAVLYLGEQDWSAVANPPEGPGLTPADGQPRCTHANLTAERGAADGADAAAAAAKEGFPPGTVVYLNVERVDAVSPELERYVRAWMAAVVAGGTVRPGIYVHADNAAGLHAAVAAELAARGRPGEVPLWVARSGDFRLDARPSDSGFSQAAVWQGLFDVRETWGGATLTIDANVARSASPSGG
jgi:hypothetical protein